MTPRHCRRFFSIVWLLAFTAGWAGADNSFGVSSPAFHRGMPIPGKYALHQENISPELRVANVPGNARSLVLIVDDPDAPAGLWTHWLVWNLPAHTSAIPEGKLPSGARQGKNSFGNTRYDGPSPPFGTHRYYFHLYALDATLSLPAGSSRTDLEQAMNGHVIGEAETFGTYRLGVDDPSP
ncbi:MAG: YbhB/YbcL family Raf kinase inhibitor-like protein [Methylacidiphilales bacterium]|nr:YbhB/YbcL family Raf kinase inhibitor-like protein [Candidatus Methylacidiphilales bacterium]